MAKIIRPHLSFKSPQSEKDKTDRYMEESLAWHVQGYDRRRDRDPWSQRGGSHQACFAESAKTSHRVISTRILLTEIEEFA